MTVNPHRVRLVNADLNVRPQYRLGDSVLLREHAVGQRAIQNVMSNADVFRHSILYQFGIKADLLDPDPQWKVLKDAADAYSTRNSLPMPGDDELVIHLRMGDLKGYKGSRDYFVAFIRETVHRWDSPINRIAVVTAIHFGESVLKDQLGAEQLNQATQAEIRRINRIVESLAEFMPSVRLFSHEDIDTDFCYLANASNLVIGSGHFSLCAAMISSARVVVPPWVKSGGMVDSRECLATRSNSDSETASRSRTRVTAAILCISRNEHPYLDEWLEYHFRLGFDRIYMVSTDDQFPVLINQLTNHEHLTKLELFHYYSFGSNWQGSCYNKFLPFVIEDWIMVMDLDEFLYLQDNETIQEFLENLDDSVGQVQFPWLMQVSNEYSPDTVTDIVTRESFHASDHVKSMVRRMAISALGTHTHGFSGDNILSSGRSTPPSARHPRLLHDMDYTRDNAFVLHLSSRGYLDTIVRILGHRFLNEKNDPREYRRVGRFLTETGGWENVPNRFLLNKLYAELPRVEQPGLAIPNMKSVIDKERLQAIFLDHLRNIVEFNARNSGNFTTEFESRFHLKQKVDELDISAAFRVDDYLESNTQIEYIRKLRRSLVADTSQAGGAMIIQG